MCAIFFYTACIQFLKIGNVYSSILSILFFFKIVKFYLEVCLLKFYVEESLYHKDRFKKYAPDIIMIIVRHNYKKG